MAYARLGCAAIKSDIEAHLADGNLSPGAVAGRQKVSDSYIRKLFEGEGTSFSQFVLARRLVRAHRMLTDRRWAERSIAWIAFEVGFGDLSYFNRTFKRFTAQSHLKFDAQLFARSSENHLRVRPEAGQPHRASAMRSCLDPTQVAALACERCFGGANMGIIMVRFVRLRFAAVAMIAAAIIAATTASGWAFDRVGEQIFSPDANGNYNFNYTDPETSGHHQPERTSIQGRMVWGSTPALNVQDRGRSAVCQSRNSFFGNSGNDRPPELTPLGNNGN